MLCSQLLFLAILCAHNPSPPPPTFSIIGTNLSVWRYENNISFSLAFSFWKRIFFLYLTANPVSRQESYLFVCLQGAMQKKSSGTHANDNKNDNSPMFWWFCFKEENLVFFSRKHQSHNSKILPTNWIGFFHALLYFAFLRKASIIGKEERSWQCLNILASFNLVECKKNIGNSLCLYVYK